MALEHYVRSGEKRLRCGYTTGTCAALAAAGATVMLLSGQAPETLCLETPKGIPVEVPPYLCERLADGARCAVQKDAGDDPDVTDGMIVEATVRKLPEGTAERVRIDGGTGVGRVTRPGLDQPVGEAAINHVPRAMIREAVLEVCETFGYDGALEVVLSIPDGERVARKTFNPILGVEGGLSILGTSGIVEPMSEQAYLDTVELHINQAEATGATRMILTPGNYGMDFLRTEGLDQLGVPVIKCSNFVGDALDMAVPHHMAEVLLVGHIGKLVKLAGGIMNTHSRVADARKELFTAHAAICGAGIGTCQRLMEADTTDACLRILTEDSEELCAQVITSLLQAIQLHLDRRSKGSYRSGAILFSNEYGELGATETAKLLREEWSSR